MASQEELLNFTVSGSPHEASRAVQECSVGHGSLSAIVVSWESDRSTVTIAVTSTQGEGFALQHTDLGTIRLTEAGRDMTRVDIIAHHPDHGERKSLAAHFIRFANDLQARFQVVP
jgi:hypothetical protein